MEGTVMTVGEIVTRLDNQPVTADWLAAVGRRVGGKAIAFEVATAGDMEACELLIRPNGIMELHSTEDVFEKTIRSVSVLPMACPQTQADFRKLADVFGIKLNG